MNFMELSGLGMHTADLDFINLNWHHVHMWLPPYCNFIVFTSHS